jgi:hypothetical protein
MPLSFFSRPLIFNESSDLVYESIFELDGRHYKTIISILYPASIEIAGEISHVI